MSRIIFLVVGLCLAVVSTCTADEIDYGDCKSLEDVIGKETEEIASTQAIDHDELAQLYVSRGESYLLFADYEKALEDFQSAFAHLRMSNNIEGAAITGFRAYLGVAVSYDNLGMQENCQLAIENLQSIVNYVGCVNCLKGSRGLEVSRIFSNEPFQTLLRRCTNDSYADIGGPDKEPEFGWCEEVVTGVGRAMDAIAVLAPNPVVKITLIGVIEALIQRGMKCCQAGGFWKACVAPITRTWREWNTNKKKGLTPNAQNLSLYAK